MAGCGGLQLNLSSRPLHRPLITVNKCLALSELINYELESTLNFVELEIWTTR
jgi:hypothetical protein